MSESVRPYVNGAYAAGAGRTGVQIFSPATGDALGDVNYSSLGDVDRAIDAARAASAVLSTIPIRRRAEMVAEVGRLITARSEVIASDIAAEQGKPIRDARDEVRAAAAMWQDSAEIARNLTDQILSSDDPQWGVIVARKPHGVVGAVTPWNFPVSIPTEYLSAGLVMGNALVWKPSELTPISGTHLIGCIEEAGFPRGSVNMILGLGADIGAALVGHRGIDAVGFTGSPLVGDSVARAAGPKPTLLELGGNNATVVLSDADIEGVASSLVAACYFNAGQVCGATERILVERTAYAELAEALAAASTTLRLGRSLDESTTLGPLTSEATAAKVDRHIADAVGRGATIVSGGKRATGWPTDLYYEPTVITGLDRDMEAFQEETFGPVAMLMPFDREDEAVDLVNGHSLGLAAGVVGEDLDRASRIARRLTSGNVNIGQVASYWQPHTPFGGFSGKASGVGRLGGRFTLEAMSQLQTFVVPSRRLP